MRSRCFMQYNTYTSIFPVRKTIHHPRLISFPSEQKILSIDGE